MTIAYTIMFSEGQKSGTSRLQAAQQAFPGLIISATRFKRVKDTLAWIGLAITIVSAVFLWQVTYGAQLAGRFDEAKEKETASIARLYDELQKERIDINNSNLELFCRIASPGGEDKPLGNNDTRSTVSRQLCNDYAYRHALFCVAICDVGSYGQSWMFQVSEALLPVHKIARGLSCSRGTLAKDMENEGGPRQEDAQSVAGVLAMMANYLLPILFGLVGTIAALVRGIQDKITESVLSPRDRALSLIRLPLGMMAGVCVGLFFNPAAVTGQSGAGIGTLTLSASGIAFLAGYGAEGFFRMLDLLITRVFSLDTQLKGPPR